jgi:hypothetical protein
MAGGNCSDVTGMDQFSVQARRPQNGSSSRMSAEVKRNDRHSAHLSQYTVDLFPEVPKARVAWLRHPSTPSAAADHLMDKFSAEGIDIWIVNTDTVPVEQVLCFDLILLESFGSLSPDLRQILGRIRMGSRAPLIMLTDGRSKQASLDALRAGADAILTVTTPVEVVFAHCMALLRRWAPQLVRPVAPEVEKSSSSHFPL